MLNTKKFTDIAERRARDFAAVDRALDVVLKFIADRDLVIYGGTAIDLALKHAGREGIYSAEAIPDYDFMSPDFYAHSIELADILVGLGFENVSSINALHVTSRRVRVNFVPVADITYIPKRIYDKIPTLTTRIGRRFIRIVHPDFQRIDLHRSLAAVYEGAPLEVKNHRANKDQKRYRLLDAAFPIVEHDAPYDVSHHKFTLRKFETRLGDNHVVFSGMVAYDVYYRFLRDYVEDPSFHDPHKYVRNIWNDVISPSRHWYIRYTNDVKQFDMRAKNASGYLFNKLLDDIRLRGKVPDPGSSYHDLLLDSSQVRLSVKTIYDKREKENIVVLSVQGLMVDILTELFLCSQLFDKDKSPDYFRYLYRSVTQMVAIAEVLYEKKILDEHNPFFLGDEFYGERTISAEYAEGLIRSYCSILDETPEVMRPKFGYHPATRKEDGEGKKGERGTVDEKKDAETSKKDGEETEEGEEKTDEEKEGGDDTFDPADSDLFQIGGDRRKIPFVDYRGLLKRYEERIRESVDEKTKN